MTHPAEAPRTSIWKFEIPRDTYPAIRMPIDAKLLTVQMQYMHSSNIEDGGKPFIWAEVNPMAATELRQFQVAGTGRGLSKNPRTYIGTWQDRFEVWHLFELLRAP